MVDHRECLAVTLPALAITALILVSLRIYSKARYKRPYGWDDYVLVLAMTTLIVSLALISRAVHYDYYGSHFNEIPPERIAPGFRLVSNTIGLVSLTVAIVENSVIITLLRFARERCQRLLLLWGICIPTNIFSVTAAVFVWHLIRTEQLTDACEVQSPMFRFILFASVWSCITDFALALLPWGIIWPLQMRKCEKILVCIGLSFGVASGVIAALKIQSLTCDIGDDITYNSAPLVIWTFTEPAAIIMAASLPTLRLFFKEAVTGVSHTKPMNSKQQQQKQQQPSVSPNSLSPFFSHPSSHGQQQHRVEVEAGEAEAGNRHSSTGTMTTVTSYARGSWDSSALPPLGDRNIHKKIDVRVSLRQSRSSRSLDKDLEANMPEIHEKKCREEDKEAVDFETIVLDAPEPAKAP
ncbi:hypothetical protein QBC35DRAFT_456695 [Podospora australis]|uniref:Rhodopsin domain-containing protein n=1 Tax=Podospora australis TaxID=1536484 RepID=A0AAN7AEJ2_9PEZI|nr:hypothetical protein QBC35DRAFT_456695 [Podospora australis]